MALMAGWSRPSKMTMLAARGSQSATSAAAPAMQAVRTDISRYLTAFTYS